MSPEFLPHLSLLHYNLSDKTLNCYPYALVITGAEATLVADGDVVSSIDAGTVTFAGQDIASETTADVWEGMLNFIGQEITTFEGINFDNVIFSVDPVAIQITGSSAGFNYTMPIASATLTFAQQDITTTQGSNYSVTGDPATLVISGGAASLRYEPPETDRKKRNRRGRQRVLLTPLTGR
jgi:hypothetical protein